MIERLSRKADFPPVDQPSVTQPGSLADRKKRGMPSSEANAANEKFDFNRALEAIWALIGEVDQYLEQYNALGRWLRSRAIGAAAGVYSLRCS